MSVQPQRRLSSILVPALILFLASTMFGQRQVGAGDEPRELSLVEKHRDRQLLDLSPDGRFWILWVLPKDYIAVYERVTQKELKRWPESKGDHDTRFLPDRDEVIIQDTLPDDLSIETSVLSFFRSGSPVTCRTPRGSHLWPLVPLPQMLIVGFRRDMEGDWQSARTGALNRFSLKDCGIPKSVRLPHLVEQIVVNGDGTIVAHTGDGIWLRDLETLKSKIHIPNQPTWMFRDIDFAPDGRTLAVRAEKSGEKRGASPTFEVLVYEVATGTLLRTLNVPKAYEGLAISPDGSMLATAYREKRRRWGREDGRAVVSLYDYYSGEELAYGEFPWELSEPIDGGGRIKTAFFTPDRKQLIVSTYSNIRIWAIPETLPQDTDTASR